MAPGLAVTFDHVIDVAWSGPGHLIKVAPVKREERISTRVLTEGWSDPELNDFAFVQLDELLGDILPVQLSSAKDWDNNLFNALDFPRYYQSAAYRIIGSIGGVIQSTVPVQDKAGHPSCA